MYPVSSILPAAGESVSEGDIARWFKEDGDIVELDEPLLELETDKASLEIPSPGSGRLSITVPEGTTVLVGEVVGHVDTAQLEQAAVAREAHSPVRHYAMSQKREIPIHRTRGLNH